MSAVTRARDFAAGALAASVALSVGELVSGVASSIPSLVIAVADVFVDETPGGIVRWSIETFGATQKTLLVSGVVAAALVIGGVLGVAGRRRFAAAASGFGAFGLLGALAAGRGQDASLPGAWLSVALAVGAGIATLALLLEAARPDTPGRAGPDRRRFLASGGAAAAVAVAGAAVGRRLRQSTAVEAARADLATRLGATTPRIPPTVDAFDAVVPGVSPLVTPTRDFYRIDTTLLTPRVDPGTWQLRVTGMVERELALDLDELLAMEHQEEFVTLSCVSNEVGGGLVGNAWWSGVALRGLLDRAGVDPAATQVVGRSVDGWTAGFPTEVALDGRPALVAFAMNGEPLPVRHGFPARLVVPGLYGYVSATKWLTEIELTTWEAFDGYWIPRGWSKEGPIETQSRIDVPRSGARVAAGTVAVAGVAWAPTRSIERVEVRTDDGPWEPARLSGALSINTWVQWVLEWDAVPGRHRLAVRATDGNGETQTAERRPPAPSGATGHHTIVVDVDPT